MHPIYLTPIGIPRTSVNIESIALVGFVPARESVASFIDNDGLHQKWLILFINHSDPSLKKFLGAEEKKEFAQWKRELLCNIYHYIVCELYKYFMQGERTLISYIPRNNSYVNGVGFTVGVNVKVNGATVLIHPIILTVRFLVLFERHDRT